MQGSSLTNATKIKRIRTFQEDMALAHAQEGAPKDVQTATVVTNFQPTTNQTVESSVPTPIPTVADVIAPTQEEIKPLQNTTSKPNLETILKKEDVTKIAIPYRASILSDSEDSFDGDTLSEGKIVTDTKRKRFNIFTASADAFKKSVNEKIATYNTQKIGPTVRKVEERIDVLKKAAVNSVSVPREDFAAVAQNLKTAERKPIDTNITLVKKSEVPKPSWSHINDAKSNEQQNLKPEVAVLETITTQQPAQPAPTLNTPKEVVEPEPKLVVADVIKPAQENINAILNPTVSALPTPTPQPSTNFVSPVLQPIVTKNTPPTPAIQYEEVNITPLNTEAPKMRTFSKTAPIQPAYREAAPQKKMYAWLPSLTLGGVIFFSTVAGVGVTYYIFSLQAQIQETKTGTTPTVQEARLTNTFILSQNRIDTLTAIQNEIGSSQGVVELSPTVTNANNTTVLATTPQILEALNFSLEGSFERAITQISFGGVEGTTPFIIIKGTNFETLFAGMLTWETLMSKELTPLFTTQNNSEPFSDTVYNNRNIRVAKSSDGFDMFVYTFVNQTTLVITQQRTDLGKILPFVQ